MKNSSDFLLNNTCIF